MNRNRFRTSRLSAVAGILVVCGMTVGASVAQAQYLGPSAIVASPDGKTLYVANTDGKQVAIVDAGSRKVSKTVSVPAEPTGLVLSPDGNTLYVTCAAPKSTVCAIDVKSGKVTASIPAGHTATGLAISTDGKKLYVCNRFSNDVSVIDLAAKKEIARVPALREPVGAVATPDGKSVFVINHLPIDQADAYDVAAEVTVIDTETNKTSSIRLPNGSGSVRGVCVSPDGKYVYAVHILSRYQMPTTQLERGWMNTNAMSIIDAAEKKLVNTVLLDDVDLGGSNPWGVATTADGKQICVSHAGTHELSVINAEELIQKLLAMPKPGDPDKGTASDDRGVYASATAADVPNDLAYLVGLRRRIRLHGSGLYNPPPFEETKLNGPRGLAIIGQNVFITGYFTDNLVAVDLESKMRDPVTPIPLGPRPKLTVQRRGEMLFNDATLCFQHWQSCASCHPDSRADALNWDLMNDGLGNPKNAKSMLLAHKTPPAMVSGVRPDAETGVRAGFTHILFAVRPEEESAAIDEYLKSMQPVPSPHLVDGKLSPAAERGKKIFFDEKIGCAKCHPEPLYTDKGMHDVGSRGQYDRRDTFDSPTLIECWRTAPYMHDGHYVTMKDLFTEGKHGLKKAKLTDEQINDLVEFVLSL